MVTTNTAKRWANQIYVVFAIVLFLACVAGIGVGHAIATDRVCTVTTVATTVETTCTDRTDSGEWAAVAVGATIIGLLASFPYLALGRIQQIQGQLISESERASVPA
jgi:hypothetical protein